MPAIASGAHQTLFSMSVTVTSTTPSTALTAVQKVLPAMSRIRGSMWFSSLGPPGQDTGKSNADEPDGSEVEARPRAERRSDAEDQANESEDEPEDRVTHRGEGHPFSSVLIRATPQRLSGSSPVELR